MENRGAETPHVTKRVLHNNIWAPKNSLVHSTLNRSRGDADRHLFGNPNSCSCLNILWIFRSFMIRCYDEFVRNENKTKRTECVWIIKFNFELLWQQSE